MSNTEKTDNPRDIMQKLESEVTELSLKQLAELEPVFKSNSPNPPSDMIATKLVLTSILTWKNAMRYFAKQKDARIIFIEYLVEQLCKMYTTRSKFCKMLFPDTDVEFNIGLKEEIKRFYETLEKMG